MLPSASYLDSTPLVEAWGTHMTPGAGIKRAHGNTPADEGDRLAQVVSGGGGGASRDESFRFTSTDWDTARRLRALAEIDYDEEEEKLGEARHTAPNLALAEASAAGYISGASIARVYHASTMALGPVAPTGYALRPSDTIVDILGTASKRLGFSVPNMPSEAAPITKPLMAHDQKQYDRCVAASICFSMYLRAAVSFDASPLLRRLRDSGTLPSVSHAFHSQLYDECRFTGRVSCGAGCKGVCDPNAGTILPFMIEACRRGVVMEKYWPVTEASSLTLSTKHRSGQLLCTHPYYTLDDAEVIDLSSTSVETALHALRHDYPIMLNAYVYGSQERFYAERGHGRGAAPKESATDVFHKHWSIPAASGAQLRMGHCMTIVGADTGRRLFKVRNSFGPRWGCDGDFNWPFDQLNEKHINALVIIKAVSLHAN